MNRVTRGQTKWTPEMDRELMNLRNYGVHPREVAEKFGVSVATVDARYYRLKKQEREQSNG